MTVMELFKGLEMAQSDELPCVVSNPEVSFAKTAPQADAEFFTVPGPGLTFHLYKHERYRLSRPPLHEAMALVKEARSGHTAVAFASSSKINGSTHAAAEHFSNFHGTLYRESDDKVVQVQFHHLGVEDQLVWETWTSNTPNGNYSRYGTSLVELIFFASLHVDMPKMLKPEKKDVCDIAHKVFKTHFSCFAKSMTNPYV